MASPSSSSSSFALFLCIIFISLASFSIADSSTPAIPSSYTDHCSSVVPKSTPHDSEYLQLDRLPSSLVLSHFTGGDQFFRPRCNTIYFGEKSFRLRILPNVYQTTSPKVHMIQATLIILSPYPWPYYNDNPGNFTYGGSYYSRRRRVGVKFTLTGFWSEISRKACMVGSANMNLGEGQTVSFTGALKLKYGSDENPTIHDSVVSGTFESTTSKNDPGWFEPVSMFAFPALTNYNYSLVSNEIARLGNSGFPKGTSLTLDPGKFCQAMYPRWIYLDLLYAIECKESRNKDCSPLGNSTGSGALPGFMILMPIQCFGDERKIRYLAQFTNAAYISESFNIESTLIAEGTWDDKNEQLFIAACRILDPKDHFGGAVGECEIRLALRYPMVWTISDNSATVGQLWRTESDKDLQHYRKVNLTGYGHNNEVTGESQELRYEYTMTEKVQKSCTVEKPVKKGKKAYPDATSYHMMFRFNLVLENSTARNTLGDYAMPLSVGNEFYRGSRPKSAEISGTAPSTNISYQISIRYYSDFDFSSWIPTLNMSLNHFHRVEINAEGVHNGETGQVCMVGCRRLFWTNVSSDCDILVNFQFAPLDSRKGEHVKGTIVSTRHKDDPFYFEDVTLLGYEYYSRMAEE